MKLIIGLGNPGPQYKKTRHNCGFMVLKALSEKWKASEFNLNKKFNSLLAEKKVKSEKILLCLPQTFMNLSGQAVAKIVRFYKIPSKDIWVIHDDVDLTFGKIRISYKSSSAGHRGVESIIQFLGHQDFVRFRLGIKPEQKTIVPAEEYVLQKFSSEELKTLDKIIKKVVSAIEFALKNGLDKAMSKFN